MSARGRQAERVVAEVIARAEGFRRDLPVGHRMLADRAGFAEALAEVVREDRGGRYSVKVLALAATIGFNGYNPRHRVSAATVRAFAETQRLAMGLGGAR